MPSSWIPRDVVEAGRQGVQVDDAVDALVILLQLDPVLQGAEPVPDVKAAGRAHAREDALAGARRRGCFGVDGDGARIASGSAVSLL